MTTAAEMRALAEAPPDPEQVQNIVEGWLIAARAFALVGRTEMTITDGCESKAERAAVEAMRKKGFKFYDRADPIFGNERLVMEW